MCTLGLAGSQVQLSNDGAQVSGYSGGGDDQTVRGSRDEGVAVWKGGGVLKSCVWIHAAHPDPFLLGRCASGTTGRAGRSGRSKNPHP